MFATPPRIDRSDDGHFCDYFQVATDCEDDFDFEVAVIDAMAILSSKLIRLPPPVNPGNVSGLKEVEDWDLRKDAVVRTVRMIDFVV